jgi:serine/threonine-protein kinase
LSKAVSLADLAARADPKKFAAVYPYFQFVKGFAEYRQGHFDRAIAILRGDASKMPSGPLPLLVLSMALHRTGKEAEARKTLASVMLNHDWRENRVRGLDDWIRHVLRREAERMIVPNLTAMLEGKQQPRDNDERLAQIGACQFENRFAALARIYAEAFAAGPKYTTHLHDAARIAVQAGCGRGIDAGGLSEAERRYWRAQARTWLREALAAMIQAIDSDFNKVRGAVRQELTKWQKEPELAGIREPTELEKLDSDEQEDCRNLWAEVNAVLDSTSKPR